jgi:hypothetical protein
MVYKNIIQTIFNSTLFLYKNISAILNSKSGGIQKFFSTEQVINKK